MRTMTYAEALVDGLWHAMRADPRVSLIGSYVLGLGPLRHHMDRIRRDFPDRVVDPPTAEAAIAGLATGAAMAGARPLVDLTTASFTALAWSQITGEAAVARLMSGGQVTAPVVFHALHGLRGGGAAQHSGSPQGMLWNAPGLEIVLPSCPRDAKGLIRRALQTENPTVFLDHAKLMAIEGPVPEEDYAIDLGVADVKRAGRDVTIVATSLMVHVALDAAVALAAEGIDAEVVDPRTLVPFDQAAILASVARTGRLVVVDEGPGRAGVAAEIAATVAEHGFAQLRAPPRRVTRADAPTPFSPPLEAALAPDSGKVVAAVRATLATG